MAVRSMTGVLSLCLWGIHTHFPLKKAPFHLHSPNLIPTFRWPSLKNTGGYTKTANYFFYTDLDFQEMG